MKNFCDSFAAFSALTALERKLCDDLLPADSVRGNPRPGRRALLFHAVCRLLLEVPMPVRFAALPPRLLLFCCVLGFSLATPAVAVDFLGVPPHTTMQTLIKYEDLILI